jgi:hypothetical protein
MFYTAGSEDGDTVASVLFWTSGLFSFLSASLIFSTEANTMFLALKCVASSDPFI